MSYNLNNITQIDDLLFNENNRSEIVKSLNLKHNVWNCKNGINYHILKYDKEWLSRDYGTIASKGLLRSLIFKDNGDIVCFAPPKSFNIEMSGLVIDPNIEYRSEQFVEGTMINVFYDKESTTWEIATRSSVGGENCFFMENGFNNTNTFKYMFNEVCENIGFDMNELNKDYVYSFVMQHPNNRIVEIIREMGLYLVDVYEIINNKTINCIPINDISLFGIKKDTVKLVNSMTISNIYDLEACINGISYGNYNIMGIIIKDSLGNRYKFRNQNYEYVRRLRGNHPKLQYQYLNLRQMKKDNIYQKFTKLTEYLIYYPEHKNIFNDYRISMHEYTNNLFKNYIDCYIKKHKPLKEFPEKYRTHMYKIHHEVYLKKLLPEKNYVTKGVVIEYFNNIHPAKQMYVLNYDVRNNVSDENPDEKIKISTESKTEPEIDEVVTLV
tara:strand:+ start:89 stop:1405 length:1317 start_codon:yes stop_codon:yes gene_type:complete